ncbi:hypothetical protein MMC28_001983 [Mycoblastus sanguinarius]|nr:hypothetical protein [Mycoblastus sanguinarius]
MDQHWTNPLPSSQQHADDLHDPAAAELGRRPTPSGRLDLTKSNHDHNDHAFDIPADAFQAAASLESWGPNLALNNFPSGSAVDFPTNSISPFGYHGSTGPFHDANSFLSNSAVDLPTNSIPLFGYHGPAQDANYPPVAIPGNDFQSSHSLGTLIPGFATSSIAQVAGADNPTNNFSSVNNLGSMTSNGQVVPITGVPSQNFSFPLGMASTPAHAMSNVSLPAAANGGRPACTQCGRTFGRVSDLERHAKKHDPGMRIYGCHVEGCEYEGSYRKDKLDAHVKGRHPSGE